MSEIRLTFTHKMNGQGKIPELNLSSRRYQSSNTVGQKSEDHGTKIHRGYEMLLNGYKVPKRKKSRSSKQTRLVEPDLSPSTRWQATGTVSERKVAANTCYQMYLVAYDRTRPGPIRRTPMFHQAFWTIYRGEKPQDFHISARKLAVLDLKYFAEDVPDIHVNFDVFPDASSIDSILELAKNEPTPVPSSLERYVPQSGAVSPVCFVALQSATSICKEKLAFAPSQISTLCKKKLDEMLPLFENWTEYVALVSLLFLTLIAYRIIRDLVLLLTWSCGFAVSYILTAPTTQQRKPTIGECLFKPQSKRHRRLRHFRDLAPQSGTLQADDGSAFKGTPPKNKKSSITKNPPKQTVPLAQPYETPVWRGQAAFGGPPRPKRNPSQWNGTLTGFGVGI